MSRCCSSSFASFAFVDSRFLGRWPYGFVVRGRSLLPIVGFFLNLGLWRHFSLGAEQGLCDRDQLLRIN